MDEWSGWPVFKKEVAAMLDVLDSPITRLVQDAERRRIARDLHDSVVQSLTALVADLEYFRICQLAASGEAGQQVVEKVQTWQALARDSLNSMRETLGTLRMPAELKLGFEGAMEVLLTSLQSAGYRIEYECEDWSAVLSDEFASNMYYIVREALTNIEKHAKASTIRICMFAFEGHLYISIADDGSGMAKQPAQMSQGSGYHQGMMGMRERAALLGGRVTFDSAQGKGTRVDIDIPYLPQTGHL